MMRIAALNDSLCEDSEDEDVGLSQEILEAEATRNYKNAIHFLANEKFKDARAAFEEVLNNPYIAKAEWNSDGRKSKNLPQDIALKYSCYKNLGQLSMQDKMYDEACQYYLKAFDLDSTEVTLWQKLGACAIKVKDFQLALVAFQEGLMINPNHWPCLDQLLSVLFILAMYEDCISLIIQALKRDPHYIKALAFKDKIFELQPSLKQFSKEYFKEWEVLFQEVPYDKSKGDIFLSTCFNLRPPPKERLKSTEPMTHKTISQTLETFSWANLVDVLVQTYDIFITEEPNAIALKVEIGSLLSEYRDRKKPTVKDERKLSSTFEKLTKRMCRSNSCNDEFLVSEFERRGSLGNITSAGLFDVSFTEEEKAILKRRRSVEFDKLSFTAESTKNEKTEVTDIERNQLNKKSDLISNSVECSLVPGKTVKLDQQPKTSGDLSQNEVESSLKDDLSQQNTNSENESDNYATTSQNEDEEAMDTDRVDGSSQELQEAFIGEDAEMNCCTEGADDQLEDIMSFEPHNQDHGHSSVGLESAETFLKLLSEVNYENEVNEDVMELMNKDFSPLMEQKVGKDSEEDDNEPEKECNGEDAQTTMAKSQEKTATSETEEGNNEAMDIDPATKSRLPVVKTNIEEETEEKSRSTKKPKRSKRGLERELEQLDYWGRRKAREAKRRRRTLASKLVGEFGDNENLTWAHLIRSFIPASLLVCEKNAEKSTNTAKLLPEISNKVENKGTVLESTETERLKENLSTKKSPSRDFDPDESVSEDTEVGDFLESSKENDGILCLLQICSRRLVSKCGRIWPKDLALAYKEMYARIRKHITVGATLSFSENPKRLFDFAQSVLVYLELLLSLSSIEKNDGSLSEKDTINIEDLLQEDSLHIEDDLFDLNLLLTRPDVWNSEYLQAHFRLGLIQFQLKTILKKHEEAAHCLQILIDQMEISTSREGEYLEVERCHIIQDEVVYDLPYFRDQLNLLQRSQIMMKIEEKFQAGNYGEVIDTLTSIMTNPEIVSDSADNLTLSRYSQLIMLTESLVLVKDMKALVEWGGKCLNEAVSTFCASGNDLQEKNKWSFAVRKILLLLFDAFCDYPCIVTEPPSDHLINLVSFLVKVLVVQLEQGANLPNPYFETLTPWIILHLILSQHERSRLEPSPADLLPNTSPVDPKDQTNHISCPKDSNKPQESSCARDQPSNAEGTSNHQSVLCKISSNELFENLEENKTEKSDENGSEESKTFSSLLQSTLLLITAHDELGKNKWCCVENGKFLLYVLDILLSEFKKRLSVEQKLLLDNSIDQIILCLFSHPSRKTKYKHLSDHGGQSIPLTWQRSLQLYQYYLPPQLPEFQSGQVPSISDDFSTLLSRITSLMPEDLKPPDQTSNLEDYIEGVIPYSGLSGQHFPVEIKDIYYLLGDYYFKNKEWPLAIKYYKLDLSINTSRIDSWAPMGLARKAQLEMLLNSCDVIKSNEELITEAHRALRCLDGGLHIDKYFSNLWVEKGGLVYMIHSFSSRVLKQDLNADMSIEMFESLERIKSNMLKLANECFTKASKIVEEGWDDEELPDERWLYQYMLGKAAEKGGDNPKDVLKCYVEAYKRLHLIGAKYPSKINYNNPPNHSIEALELFYRIVVFIFKHVTVSRESLDVSIEILQFFLGVLKKLEKSPFVLMDSKMEVEDGDFIDVEEIYSNVSRSSQVTAAESTSEECSFTKKGCETPAESETAKKEIGVGSETKSSQDVKRDFDKVKNDVIDKCLEYFHLCVTRFPQHYKSLFRLAFFYFHSRQHKDTVKARNLLLGCSAWQSMAYMPNSGLFSERKVSVMNPKSSNWFHSIWRIPHDEIDRSGSFAAHMYRCVSLCVDVLQEMNEFHTILELSLALKNSPDKDKKYLRDNEREILSEHATQVGIQCMKEKYRLLFNSQNISKENRHAFLYQVYRAYKQMARHLDVGDSVFSKMLTDTYSSFVGAQKENQFIILREAENFCARNPHPPNSDSSSRASSGVQPQYSSNIGRRGRPPSFSRNVNDSFQSKISRGNITSGQTIAVQQAYKVYESLIETQRILKVKTLDKQNCERFQKKYEELKKQMLRYLQIPNVSHFFHNSLQSHGKSEEKLPPPVEAIPGRPKLPAVNQRKQELCSSNISVPLKKYTIEELAAKSQLHGISISSVSKNIDKTPKKVSSEVVISKLPFSSSSPASTSHSALTITKAPAPKSMPIAQPSSELNNQPTVTIVPASLKQSSDVSLVGKTDSLSILKKAPHSNKYEEVVSVSKSSSLTKGQATPCPQNGSKTTPFQASFLASLSRTNSSSQNVTITKSTVNESFRSTESQSVERSQSDAVSNKKFSSSSNNNGNQDKSYKKEDESKRNIDNGS